MVGTVSPTPIKRVEAPAQATSMLAASAESARSRRILPNGSASRMIRLRQSSVKTLVTSRADSMPWTASTSQTRFIIKWCGVVASTAYHGIMMTPQNRVALSSATGWRTCDMNARDTGASIPDPMLMTDLNRRASRRLMRRSLR